MSTSRSRAGWLLIAGLAISSLAITTSALDPNRTVGQYLRDFWGTEKGFPGGAVSSIAQTPDGYLWLGTDKGLVRFDGASFRKFDQANSASTPIGAVQKLQTDQQGNLWILLGTTQLLRYHDGMFELVHGEAENGVTAIGPGARGTVVVSSMAAGALKFDAQRFVSLLAGSGPAAAPTVTAKGQEDLSLWSPTDLLWSTGLQSHRLANPRATVTSIAEAGDGKIWLGTDGHGLFYLNAGKLFAAAKGSPEPAVTSLLPDGPSNFWIATRKGLLRWDGAQLTSNDVPATLANVEILSMIRDRDGNLWLGTTHGLLRFDSSGISPATDGGPPGNPAITALYEDREGNLWTGNTRGIGRFRDSTFVTYPIEGAQTESSGPVYVDGDGRAWFAGVDGGLHWLKDSKQGVVTNDALNQEVIYSIAGSGNDLWIGRQRGGLTHLHYNGGSITAKTYTQADGLAQNGVYAVYVSNDGTIWAATLSGGVSAFSKNRFTTYTTANALASDTVAAIAESADGTMWFATPNGLSAFAQDQWRIFTTHDGLPTNDVNCILPDGTGTVWIGTASGLAVLRSGRAQRISGGPASLQEPILGIADDKAGRLWIATASHILSAKRDPLLAGKWDEAEVREYGPEDGLLGMEGVKRHRSVVADNFGHIWISTNRGLSVADAKRASSSAPAIAHIETLTEDENNIAIKQPLHLPPGGRRVTFSYTGLSLAVPERVRFKYKLENFDKNWSEPTSARLAIYTNLGPGSYRFRLVANNSDGLWNGSETDLAFKVDPLFWQTWWFRISSVLALGILALTFYRLRLMHLTQQMNIRFEERLAERTRIAQDLHDTLLQGLLSASMQLHIADQHLPADSPGKATVGRVLELMAQVVDEGRNALKGLRSSQRGALGLGQAFSRVQQELGPHHKADFRVIVAGVDQPLHPYIQDEVYGIGREALANAFRHSQATQIEVELEYAPAELRVLVRDNGIGIDSQVLTTGRDGHWGLLGMRERARKIGAELRVLSRVTAGTEVELSVPARVAFSIEASGNSFGWLSGSLFRKKEPPKNSH